MCTRPKVSPQLTGNERSELGSVVNDSAVRCQSRTLTEPQRERGGSEADGVEALIKVLQTNCFTLSALPTACGGPPFPVSREGTIGGFAA